MKRRCLLEFFGGFAFDAPAIIALLQGTPEDDIPGGWQIIGKTLFMWGDSDPVGHIVYPLEPIDDPLFLTVFAQQDEGDVVVIMERFRRGATATGPCSYMAICEHVTS